MAGDGRREGATDMGRIVCEGIVSLDGYTSDRTGDHQWGYRPEIGDFLNGRLGRVGLYLLGRRMYEELAVWDTLEVDPDAADGAAGYQRHWLSTDKVVYSRSLPAVTIARTRLEREFDPGAVRRLAATVEGDVSVSGPTLAAEAFRAGLIEETAVYMVPRTVGGGTPFFPPDVQVELELVEHHALPGGTVYLRHRVVR
jgi:dihydrofolate reductase